MDLKQAILSMRSGLNLIFWGQLLLIFDFRINGFDLAPDSIGLLLNACGCSMLAARSNQFRHAFYLSISLGCLWILALFASGSDQKLLGYASLFCNCWMMWALLGGIRDVALQQQHLQIAESAQVRRIAYVGISASFVLAPYLVVNPFSGVLGFIISIALMLTILVLVLSLIHKAGANLK